jgi:hypothetical protein
MAAIGWIDFSRKTENRVSSIWFYCPEGQVDELGIGTIRMVWQMPYSGYNNPSKRELNIFL